MLSPTSRRAWVRYPCDAKGKRTATTTQRCMVLVLDISESGFKVALPRPPRRGQYLTLEVLLGPQRFSRRRLAQVKETRPGVDGNWYTYCEYHERLGDDSVHWPLARS
jgi:PilZ domain